VANLLGRLAAAASSVIAAPVVIHAIGREGFGVVTFALSFLTLAALLDLGLSATANRAIARASASGGDACDQSNLLRTFELIHWSGAAVICLTTYTISGWAAREWLQLSSLRPSDGASVVALTGLMLGFRFPVGLYSGVLFGFRRHVAQNLILGSASVIRYLGGAVLVALVSPSVLSYSKWLAVTGLAETLVAATLAWTSVGGRRSFLQARYDPKILARHRRFSFIFAVTGAIGSLATSLDRVVLGKMLPTADLGLYGLLYTPAGTLTLVATALALTIFPEFAAAAALPGAFEARKLLARSQSFTLVCVALIAIPMAIQFGPVLRIWTRDAAIARDGLIPGVILLAALAANAVAYPAYVFMVASGQPLVALRWNVYALVLSGVGLFLLVPRFGLTGAAVTALAVNTLGLGFYLLQTSRIFKPQATAIRRVSRLLIFGGALCACNLAIAVAWKSDLLRLALSCLTSLAAGCFLFRRADLIGQVQQVEPGAP